MRARNIVGINSTLRKLTSSELHNDSEKIKRAKIDEIIKKKLGDSMMFSPDTTSPHFIHYHDKDEPDPFHILTDNDQVDENALIYEKAITDYWINNEVCLPQGENNTHAKVIDCSKDADVNAIGSYNDNPIKITMVYDVEFPDGVIKNDSTNIIAEIMYAQVDPDGHSHGILDAILDFKKDDTALSRDNMYITNIRRRRWIRQTATGWNFLIQMKDDSDE